jgi:hypothetical protein
VNKIGALQIIIDRQRMWGGQITLLLSILANIKLWGWEWWYLLVIPIWILFSMFDYKILLPAHLDKAMKINPEIQALRKDVKQVLDKIGETPDAKNSNSR